MKTHTMHSIHSAISANTAALSKISFTCWKEQPHMAHENTLNTYYTLSHYGQRSCLIWRVLHLQEITAIYDILKHTVNIVYTQPLRPTQLPYPKCPSLARKNNHIWHMKTHIIHSIYSAILVCIAALYNVSITCWKEQPHMTHENSQQNAFHDLVGNVF